MIEQLCLRRSGNKRARFINWWAGLCIGLSVISCEAMAQTNSRQLRDDHLQPVPNYFAAYRYQDDYYAQIRRYLLDSLGDQPVARVVVKPSFSSEYVVSVDSANGTYSLTYSRMNKSIWYVKKKEVLQAITTKTSISKALAQALNQLFFEAAIQTRYPKRRFSIGPNGQKMEELSMSGDGTTYIFMAFGYGHGIWSGQTWSPPKNTRMSDLVDISDAMVKFTADTTRRETKVRALLEQCQTLYKKIAEPR